MKKTITFFITTLCFVTSLKAQISSTFLELDGFAMKGLSIDEGYVYIVGSPMGLFTNYGAVFRKELNSTYNHYETFNMGGNGYNGICKVGDYIYISKTSNTGASYGIKRFNINNDPITIEHFLDMNKPMGLANRDSELYVSSQDKIYKIDLTAANPVLQLIVSDINVLDSWGSIGLKIYDNHLYIPETTGISKINLDTLQKQTLSTYTGLSLARGGDENTFYLTGGEDYATVYELNIQTQTYTPLIQIDDFIGTYNIVFADNKLFVTTQEGNFNKVARIDLNPLSTDDSQQNTLAVYPNPASEFINVKGFEPNENITIIHPNGQIIKSVKIENNRINISELEPGVYFLKNKNNYSRFIKK